MVLQIADSGTQHFGTMFAGTVGICAHAEQRSDITKVRGCQQCVDQRMCDDVTIGITCYAITLPMQSGKP